MAGKTLTRVQGGVTETIHINRDRFAGVRALSSGYVYPAKEVGTSNQDYFVLTKTDDRNWRVVSDLSDDELGEHNGGKKFTNLGVMRTGLNRISFDVELHSGDLNDPPEGGYSLRLSYRDRDDDPAVGYPIGSVRVTEGHNEFDFNIFNDGDQHVPQMYFAYHSSSKFDVSITNLKIIHNPRDLSVDRTAAVIDSDRKGESRPLLSKVVGGASAAYSLRDLNDKAGNNKVVRVRRDTDNSERDFRANEIGTPLEKWVNTQSIAPLDIGTEVNGTRVHIKDGGTSIGTPVGAYSLRSLGDAQADVIPVEEFSFTGATGTAEAYNGIKFKRLHYPRQGKAYYEAETPDGTAHFMFFIESDNTINAWRFKTPTIGNIFSSNSDDPRFPWEADWTGTDFQDAVFGEAEKGKYVAAIRRSSDDLTKSFTQEELEDGTAVDWVNTIKTVKYNLEEEYADFDEYANVRTDFVESFEGVSNVMKVTAEGGTVRTRPIRFPDRGFRYELNSGEIYHIKFKYFIPDTGGNQVEKIKLYVNGSGWNNYPDNVQPKLTTTGQWVEIDQEVQPVSSAYTRGYLQIYINAAQESLKFTPQDNGNDCYYLADIEVSIKSANGKLDTWYDQSGNANHLHQINYLTAYGDFNPTVIKGSNYLGEVDFDDLDGATTTPTTTDETETLAKRKNNADRLGAPFELNIDPAGGSEFASFIVAAYDKTVSVEPQVLLRNAGTEPLHSFKFLSDGSYSVSLKDGVDTANIGSGGRDLGDNQYHLFNTLIEETSGRNFIDGTVVGQGLPLSDINSTSNSSNELISTTKEDTPFYGQVKEIILYDTAQLDNRAAIEANIGDYYNLSEVPTSIDNRNGHVSVWYDQSGLGNDLYQSAVNNQPYIVKDGVVAKTPDGRKAVYFLNDTLGLSGADGKDMLSDTGHLSCFIVGAHGDTTNPPSTWHNFWKVLSDEEGANSRRPFIFRTLATDNMTLTYDSGGGPVAAMGTDVTELFSCVVTDRKEPDGAADARISISKNGGDQSSWYTQTLNKGTTLWQAGIGSNYSNRQTNSGPYAQWVSEIIHYTSDQSANLPAIEANILNQYEI
jgi:hypothetical protein